MPTDPRKTANPKTVNSILVDRGIRHAIYLQRLAGGEANWIKDKMPQLRKAITVAITPILADINSSGVISVTDEVLINEAATKASRAAQEFFEEVQGEQMTRLGDIAVFEADFEKRLFEKAIPIEMNFRVPSNQQLRSFLTTEAIAGKTMNQWFSDLTLTTRTLVNDSIRQGLIEGESIGDIVRRIRGRRENGFADGVLNTTTRHAEALARTGVMSASNKARQAFHEANPELVRGYSWILTLDSRTCFQCVSGESQNPYPPNNPPDLPAHPQCRCLRVVITPSYRELGLDIDEPAPGTRASSDLRYNKELDRMDGSVPDTMDYEEWFNKQPASFQKDVLGESRYDLFKQGRPVTAFADRGQVLTLDQLRGMEPDLFG